jgi:hypothetical protein
MRFVSGKRRGIGDRTRTGNRGKRMLVLYYFCCACASGGAAAKSEGGCERAEEKEAVINRTNHAIGGRVGLRCECDSDMGTGLGRGPRPVRLDPIRLIRFDGVSTLLFLFDLLLCLSPALARSLSGWRRPGRENLERDGDGASSGNPEINGALAVERRPAADGQLAQLLLDRGVCFWSARGPGVREVGLSGPYCGPETGGDSSSCQLRPSLYSLRPVLRALCSHMRPTTDGNFYKLRAISSSQQNLAVVMHVDPLQILHQIGAAALVLHLPIHHCR